MKLRLRGWGVLSALIAAVASVPAAAQCPFQLVTTESDFSIWTGTQCLENADMVSDTDSDVNQSTPQQVCSAASADDGNGSTGEGETHAAQWFNGCAMRQLGTCAELGSTAAGPNAITNVSYSEEGVATIQPVSANSLDITLRIDWTSYSPFQRGHWRFYWVPHDADDAEEDKKYIGEVYLWEGYYYVDRNSTEETFPDEEDYLDSFDDELMVQFDVEDERADVEVGDGGRLRIEFDAGIYDYSDTRGTPPPYSNNWVTTEYDWSVELDS